MVNYACGFNQSETGKCFEWIISDNTLTLQAFALSLITLPSFMTHLTALAIRPPFNHRFLQNGLIEYIWGEVTIDCGILNRNLSNEKLHVFSCRYVIICFLPCNRQEAYHTPRWPTQSCIDCSVLVTAWKGLTCAPMTCTFLDKNGLRFNKQVRFFRTSVQLQFTANVAAYLFVKYFNAFYDHIKYWPDGRRGNVCWDPHSFNKETTRPHF